MNRKNVVGWACALAVLAATCGVSLAQGRIAVVQMDKVVRAYPEAQKAEATLKTVKEEYEKELEKMDAKGKELQQAFESAASEVRDKSISESEREKRYEAAQQQAKALQEYQLKMRQQRNENQRDLADQEMRLFKRVIGKLSGVIADYAAAKKIDLVLDAAGVGVHGGNLVLYSASSLDITDDIIKIIEVPGGKEDPAAKKTDGKK